MSILLYTALILGLSGSLHCVGMCGPVVLALPLTVRERMGVVAQTSIYHLGRILTYSFLGLLFGGLGQGLVLVGWQKGLSIGLGVLMLVGLFFSWSIERQVIRVPGAQRFFQAIKNRLGKNLRLQSPGAIFRIGLLNGLLPCGLVYVALFGAVNTGHYLFGALYMFIFGLGTTPLLFSLMIAGKRLPQSWRSILKKVSPILLGLVAILLIYRGVRLEVPTELNFWEATNHPIMCH